MSASQSSLIADEGSMLAARRAGISAAMHAVSPSDLACDFQPTANRRTIAEVVARRGAIGHDEGSIRLMIRCSEESQRASLTVRSSCTRPTLGDNSRSVLFGFVLGPERLHPRGEPPAAELLGHGQHDFIRTGTKIHVDRVRTESGDPEERGIP